MKTIIGLVAILVLGVGISAQTANTAKPADANPSGEGKDFPLLTVMKIGTAEQSLRLCSMDPANDLCKDKNAKQELTDLYASCTRDAKCSPLLMAKIISEYTSLREGARGAVQVSQAADEAGVKMQMVVMAQNQRIIELLEQLVKKQK